MDLTFLLLHMMITYLTLCLTLANSTTLPVIYIVLLYLRTPCPYAQVRSCSLMIRSSNKGSSNHSCCSGSGADYCSTCGCNSCSVSNSTMRQAVLSLLLSLLLLFLCPIRILTYGCCSCSVSNSTMRQAVLSLLLSLLLLFYAYSSCNLSVVYIDNNRLQNRA